MRLEIPTFTYAAHLFPSLLVILTLDSAIFCIFVFLTLSGTPSFLTASSFFSIRLWLQLEKWKFRENRKKIHEFFQHIHIHLLLFSSLFMILLRVYLYLSASDRSHFIQTLLIKYSSEEEIYISYLSPFLLHSQPCWKWNLFDDSFIPSFYWLAIKGNFKFILSESCKIQGKDELAKRVKCQKSVHKLWWNEVLAFTETSYYGRWVKSMRKVGETMPI